MPKAAIIYWLMLYAVLAGLFSRFDEDSLPPTSAWDKYFLLGDVLFALACLIFSWFAIHWHAITPVHRF